LIGTIIKKKIFIAVYSGLFTKNSIVDDFEASIHSFNDFKWFSIIIKISKLYEVKRINNIIKTITINIVKFDFFHYNGSIYKNTIEVVYIPKISVNFISIKEF